MNLEDFYLWADAGRDEDAAEEGQPARAPRGSDREVESEKAVEQRHFELVRQDPDHFEYFVERYYDKIFRYAYWVSGDHDAAADVANETFVSAWQSLDRFEWRGGGFKSWLYRIARNLLYRRRRRMQERSETRFEAGLHDPIDEGSPERLFGRERDLALVRRCMERLRPEPLEVMILQHFEGMTARQIADALDLPLGTVHSHLKRGRRQVLRLMDGKDIRPLLTEETRRIVRRALAEEGEMRLIDGDEPEPPEEDDSPGTEKP